MRRLLTLALVGLVLLGTGVATAQIAGDPEKAVELFFSGLAAGEIPAALDRLCVGSPLEAEQQQLKVLKTQIEGALPLYGALIGTEIVYREEFGSSLVRLVYLQKFERHPLVWEFYFYRARGPWMLMNIRFNDQLDLLKRVG